MNTNEVLASSVNSTIFAGRFGPIQVAIKQNTQEEVKYEFMMLVKVSEHVNILRYQYPPTQINRKHVLVTEIFSYTLKDGIRRIFNEKSLMLQLANAVDHLQKVSVIHLGISPQNIFIVAKENELVLKLANFENAQYGTEIQAVNPRNLAEGFSAPEITYTGKAYPESCLWSLGCVYFFIFTGGFKIQCYSADAVSARLKANIDPSNDGILLKHLLTKILNEPRGNRMRTQNIMQHPYFWNTSKTLDFIVKISNRMESSTEFATKICKGQHLVIHGDWTLNGGVDQKLLKAIITADQNHQRQTGAKSSDNINGKIITSLVRKIRNLICHARSTEVAEIVGSTDEEFLEYWTSKFPSLIMHLYDANE